MNIISKLVGMVVVWLFISAVHADEFEDLVSDLNASSYSAKGTAIERLQSVNDPRTLITLKAMLDGDLYLYKPDAILVVGEKQAGEYQIAGVLSQTEIGSVVSGTLEKVKINNSVRGRLRTAIALLQLKAEDKALRLQSARDLLKKPDPGLRDLLVEAISSEGVSSVRKEMQLALAMIDVYSPDQDLRKTATQALAKSVAPESLAILEQLSERSEDGEYSGSNEEIATLAEKSLEQAQSRVALMKFFENLFFGVSLGSVLLLAAIGLAITFGVMGVINMAHGEMIMLGAYTTFAVQTLFPGLIEYSIAIAIPAAFLVAATVGIIIERLVIRHLYGRPLETLLATFGISLFLQQLVRSYDSNNVPVVTPDWMSGLYQVNGALSFTYNRFYIIIFSLMVLAVLAVLLRKTLLGLQMRAVTQNRPMANSMGIRSSWVDALTFGLGSGLAGIAGVALSQVTNVGPNMGQGYIIDSFMVVVFGGVGNLMGTFIAAMGLGIVSKFLEPHTGAVLGKILVLIFIILFIQWRPRGLFALKGRFVGD